MLSVREASELLGVSQKTVYRWINSGRIPYHRLGAQYYLERSEVNNMVVREGIVPIPEGKDPDDLEEDASLHEILQRGGVFYRVGGKTKREVLQNALGMIKGLDNSIMKPLFEMFICREELSSTGIGEGIAIPHARGSLAGYVNRPILSLSFLESPIEYGALDGKPVHALFLLISPNVRSHLRILAKLSFALQNAACKEAILNQASRDTIMDLFARMEADLSTTL